MSKEGHVEDQDHVLCVDSFAEIIWRRISLALGVPSAMANERFLREGYDCGLRVLQDKLKGRL